MTVAVRVECGDAAALLRAARISGSAAARVLGPAALDLEPAALSLEVSPLLDGVGVVRGGRIGLTEHVGEEPVGTRIPTMMRFGEDV